MKTKFNILFILAILLSHINYAIPSDNKINHGSLKTRFLRTFKNKSLISNPSGSSKNKIIATKNSVSRNQLKRNTDDISITFSDFSDHLAFGKTRIASQFTNAVTMNIGARDAAEKETWVLPNPSTDNIEQSIIDQLDAEGTAIYESFENEGTHVLYFKESKMYQLFNLEDDIDLFLLGTSELEDDERVEYNLDQSLSPVPLEMDLEFSSVVTYEDTDDETSYSYTDTYIVIGQGTLETYDDGNADALKMIYKEEYRAFENDVEIDYEVRYQVVFYSKKGHYITADIEDPNAEGNVVLENLIYQKIQGKTASIDDNMLANVNVFPNPVNTGEVLKFTSAVSLEKSVVNVHDISGKKLAALQLYQNNNNQYEINIPQNLANGLYFYTLKSKNGAILTNGKIQVK